MANPFRLLGGNCYPPLSQETIMTIEHRPERPGPTWAGRLAVVLIVAFIVLVLTLMFFAARGPSA